MEKYWHSNQVYATNLVFHQLMAWFFPDLSLFYFKYQEAVGAKTIAVHDAEDSRGLWESEVKARSKLGLRVSIQWYFVAH